MNNNVFSILQMNILYFFNPNLSNDRFAYENMPCAGSWAAHGI